VSSLCKKSIKNGQVTVKLKYRRLKITLDYLWINQSVFWSWLKLGKNTLWSGFSKNCFRSEIPYYLAVFRAFEKLALKTPFAYFLCTSLYVLVGFF
jgi:hypothetical protein